MIKLVLSFSVIKIAVVWRLPGTGGSSAHPQDTLEQKQTRQAHQLNWEQAAARRTELASSSATGRQEERWGAQQTHTEHMQEQTVM